MGNQFAKLKKNETPLLVLGALGVLLVGGSIYYSQRKQEKSDLNSSEVQKKDVKPTQVEESKQVTSVTKLNNNNDKLKLIADGIKVDIEQDGFIHIETLVQILERSPELVSIQYRDLTIQNRQQRRAVRKSNPHQYQDLALQYNDEVELILEEAQIKLLEQLDIPKDVFEKSIIHYMQKGFVQNFMMLQGQIRQQIKESLKSTKTVTWQQTKDILRSQVEIIQRELTTIQEALRNLAEQCKGDQEKTQLIPSVIQVMLSDFIYEQHGIEDEDLVPMLSNPSMVTDPEIQTYLMQIEQQMMILMQGAQLFNGMGDEGDMEQMLNGMGMGMDQMGQMGQY